jgi:hypothetical protein
MVRFRILAVAVVALAFALTQKYGSALSVMGDASAFAASLDGQRPATVVQADNADSSDDNSDDSSDDSDTSSDNSNADEDNSDDSASDNSSDDETDADNSDSGDDASASSAPAAPAIDDAALKQPLTAATGTSTGSDSLIATPGERVALRIFPWMPAGVEITIRPVDASTVAAAPGTRAGDLTFAVEARDASGTQLTALPAEANLAIRYADSTVSGLNEGNLTVSRLDTATNQWQAAPKQVREPDSNYVAASIVQLGTYTVSAP